MKGIIAEKVEDEVHKNRRNNAKGKTPQNLRTSLKKLVGRKYDFSKRNANKEQRNHFHYLKWKEEEKQELVNAMCEKAKKKKRTMERVWEKTDA